MAEQVRHWREGDVAVLRMAANSGHRPGPLIDAALCHALSDALRAQQGAGAVVIGSDGPGFGWGPEPSHMPDARDAAALAELCDQLEAMPCAVVVALSGATLGAGLELALAAHYRIGAADTRLGMPDIMLGMPPGSGATQRLPRLIGVAEALRMLLSGQAIDATTAQALGLLDEIAAAPEAAALALAQSLVGEPPRPTLHRTDRLDRRSGPPAIQAARTALRDPVMPGPRAVIDCIEASLLLPEAAGLAFERVTYEDCLQSEAARGLRHAALGEQRAARLQDAAAQGATPPQAIALIGKAPVLAEAALAAGLRVVLFHPEKEQAIAALHDLAAHLETAVAKGRLAEAQATEVWTRLLVSAKASALAEVDLALVADGDERIPVPQGVVSACLRPRKMLAGSLTVGLRPIPGPLLPRVWEITFRPETAPRAVAVAYALVRRLGRTALPAGDGSTLLRVFAALLRAMDKLLLDRAGPDQVDAALRASGMAQGPFRTLDVVGLDSPLGELAAEGADVIARLRTLGWTGRASGQGFYDYQAEGPRPNVLLKEELASLRSAEPKPLREAAIWETALAAMAQEAALLLADDEKLRPWMIDLGLVQGFGFPRWRGGPLAAADTHGLSRICARLQDMDIVPAPLLVELAADGGSFDTLNRGRGFPAPARVSPE